MTDQDFELAAGQMVGEYRVERKIGEGAFGVVYAAVHPVIGKPAAIKVLRPALSANPEMVARFADEARAVNQIRHRHIIDIFSFGTLPNGASYFVMELLTGMTLQKYLKTNGPLDPGLMASILWPVGRALIAAHKAGIAHRDLKPENVYLVMDQDGEMFPKLLDFGIAKLMGEEDMATRTKTGMVLGTPVYMSPEQCRATKVDHRADIYSFGIMIHEALAGSRPFDAENVMDVMMRQISDPPPRLSDVRPGLPKALDVPILRMLEKSPAKRPQTMLAALDELAEALRASGIAAPPSSGQAAAGPLSGSAQPAAPAVPALSVPGAALASAGPPLSTAAFLAGNASVASGPASAPMTGPPSGAAPYSSPQAQSAAPYSNPQGWGAPATHSHAAPGGGPVSQGAPAHYPAPGGDVATMLSAGVGAPPSLPGGPMSGPVPVSAAVPPAAPQPSRVPLLLAAGSGAFVVLLLLVVAAFAFGDDGDGSGSGAAATSSATASSAAGGVMIGGAPPRVGRTFHQETDTALQMTVTAAGHPPMSETHKSHLEYKATVLAVNEWHATRVEVQYLDHFDVEQEGKKPEKKTVSPTAHRGFFVASQDKGASVGSMDGKEIDEDTKSDVLSTVSDLVAPRPDVFKRPLSVGDSLSPPSSVAVHLLGIPADDEEISMRPENTVLRLTAIDRAAQSATFDVKLSLVFEEAESKVTFTAALQGTMTFDIPTGIPAAGMLSGPVTGSVTEGPVKASIAGSMSLRVKGHAAAP